MVIGFEFEIMESDMGYNGWPIPLRLLGIMVVLFSKNKYPVQDNEYDYHDSL